jgi:hypothetical protein
MSPHALTRRSSLALLGAMLPGAAIAEPAVPTEKAAALKVKKLFDELMIFKSNPEFHRLGFTPASPFRIRAGNVTQLRGEMRKIQRIVLIKAGFTAFPNELYNMALDYMKSAGRDTEYISAAHNAFKATFANVLGS